MLYLNGTPLNVTKFPDGTSQVWKLQPNQLSEKVAQVSWKFESEGEILHLAQLKALLNKHGVKATLMIEYLPFARQDKPVSNDATFALLPFTKILNSFDFAQVTIVDPHSVEALKQISYSTAKYPVNQVNATMATFGHDLICYPDKGALEKYSKIYDHPFIYGEKVRDQATGNITSYQVVGDPAGKTVLIVDDICDGGMTFKILAKDLLAKGAKEVNLFITHGLFTKGVKTLHESGINRVFTHDGEKSER